MPNVPMLMEYIQQVAHSGLLSKCQIYLRRVWLCPDPDPTPISDCAAEADCLIRKDVGYNEGTERLQASTEHREPRGAPEIKRGVIWGSPEVQSLKETLTVLRRPNYTAQAGRDWSYSAAITPNS